MAMRLEDVLVRRLHLFYEERDQAARAAPVVAAKLAQLFGWDAAREGEEVAAYRELAERSRAFLRDIGRTAAAIG